jgi:hypothetical protein
MAWIAGEYLISLSKTDVGSHGLVDLTIQDFLSIRNLLELGTMPSSP